MNKKNQNYNQIGLTLMEILVSLGIFLLINALIWMFVKQSYFFQSFVFEQTTSINEAQRGVETMIKEIREAVPGDTGAYPIEKADKFELIFFSDYDRDVSVERIRYYLNGSDFIKAVTEASGTPLQYLPQNEVATILSRYVRNTGEEPVFAYFNGDYPNDTEHNPLTTPADPVVLKLIHVHLEINAIPDKAPKEFNLESDVQVRNLKDNL
jgi:Tfp pilus assembly protein PilW